MLQKIIHGSRQLFLLFLFGICFLLPFEPKFLATVEILTLLFFFVGYSPKHIFNRLKNEKAAWPFLLFFVLTAITATYSTDQAEAMRQVEVKLPFLVIPLLLWGSGISRKNAKTAMMVFVAGCACACLVLLALAIRSYTLTGDETLLVYMPFSRFMHVSYFSLYLLVGFGWLFMLAMKDSLWYPRFFYAVMLLFVVCFTLLSAKIMLFTFVGASFLFAGYYAKRRKQVGKALLLVGCLIALPVLLYFTSTNVRLRVDGIRADILNRNTYVAPQNLGSTAIRIIIWKDALPQIKQNLPWGVGAGDVKNQLLQNYAKRDMQLAIDKKLNMHNEYLQQLAGQGIPGFLLFVVLLLLPALLCAPPHRFIGTLFSFSVACVSLTESILERQAGTIFLCLAGILLIIAYQKERKSLPNS